MRTDPSSCSRAAGTEIAVDAAALRTSAGRMGEAGEVPGGAPVRRDDAHRAGDFLGSGGVYRVEARFDGGVHLGSVGADPSDMVGNTDRLVGAP